MIVVRLISGLGNQLFQYAAARRLAEVHNTKLILDLSIINNKSLNWVPTFREYALDKFNINASIATHNELKHFTHRSRSFCERNIAKLFHKRYKARPFSIIREDELTSPIEILDLPDNVLLEGYWQSERYFADIAPLIRKEFTFASQEEGRNAELLAKIRQGNSICVHVRRGDYAYHKETNEMFGLCGLDYYNNAMSILCSEHCNVHFYVFSDDPNWAKSNICIRKPITYVDENSPSEPWEDLRLMHNCKHFITANSTFSWWAAWLSLNASKTIITPRKWYNDHKLQRKLEKSGLILHSWIRL